MEKVPYQYQPLQNNNTIRILVLYPGQQNDPLRGTLKVVPIDAAGSYEAVSYVWADPMLPNSKYEIIFRDSEDNERILALRGGSIYAALNHMRLSDRPRRVWADQCCINQDNPVERSQQVQFMNRIYRDAAQVLVWLGLETEKEAVSAFSLVHELYAVLNNLPVDPKSGNPDTLDLERHIRNNKKAIQDLTERAWFKRGWIVQEIGTSTPATMMWGDATIKWDKLANVCERLKSYHHLRNTLEITTSDIAFLFRRFIEPEENTHHANRFNFVYELHRARHLQFSDNRDRVFAFLGHYSVRSLHPLGCGPISIIADYTKTIEQTYLDVAIQILKANPGAACILLAAVQHPRHGLPSHHGTAVQAEKSLEAWLGDQQKLPSWVPDWRQSEAIILAEPICPHHAHGNSSAKLEVIHEGGFLLRVHGLETDLIEECSLPLHSNDFYSKKAPGQPLTMVERLWHDICKKKRFDLNDKYPNGQSSFFAYMQTLSNGCVQAAGHECKPYNEVSDCVWLWKAARYIVETLGPSDDVSEEVQKAAEGAECESWHEKWCRWATSALHGRILARTRRGYYILGPSVLEAGDVVCILFGSKVPFCLRPIGKRYLMVGECYVHGLMKGEAIEMLVRDELREKIFDIV